MTSALNQGPSFNLIRSGLGQPKLSGFYQRFMLEQNDNRMTPGKAEPHLPKETMKGTTKSKKPNRKTKDAPRCRDAIPQKQYPIYGGFGSSKPNYATTAQPKRKRRKKAK